MTIKSKDTLSKRPGRISAGSIAFGRLVAANTIIPYKKKSLLVNTRVDLISRITQSYLQAKFTVANSKPSISVNKVDKSFSPTVTPPLEFPPGPVLQDHRSTNLSYFVVKFRFSTLNLKAMITSGVHMNHLYTLIKKENQRNHSTGFSFLHSNCSIIHIMCRVADFIIVAKDWL